MWQIDVFPIDGGGWEWQVVTPTGFTTTDRDCNTCFDISTCLTMAAFYIQILIEEELENEPATIA